LEQNNSQDGKNDKFHKTPKYGVCTTGTTPGTGGILTNGSEIASRRKPGGGRGPTTGKKNRKRS